MPSLPISVGKRLGESIKAGCRFLCRPLLPILPDAVVNRLPFLGQIRVHGPDNLRLRMHTYGPHGKDRIAIKLARRGLAGYEGETTRLFMALVKDAKTVIDVGANTGLFALLAGLANPACRVWAFEPVSFIFNMLQQNIRLNGLANVEAIPMAVADFVGESTFYITRTNVGIPTDSSVCQGFRDQVDEHRVPTTTLDEFSQRQSLPRIDLVKIDAESAESKVIRSAITTIRWDRPYLICEILEGVDHSFLQDTFPPLDYQFYHITRDRLTYRDRLHGSLDVERRNHLIAPAEKIPLLQERCREAGILMDES
ncbi:MAG: FkbM family methyltransferase [Planctomycetes bacterium]|nr:FkbM family methyltransferase [Planctomycetota bacterium]